MILRGGTSVGEGTVIGAGSQIVDSQIGARARVWASIIESSVIEDEAKVGSDEPRPAGQRRSAGAPRSATTPSSRTPGIGAGSKQHHMSYLGDAELGEGANVGAGTITANYDGTNKHRTTIGDGAFLGVDTMIVAPRDIGKGAKTGAGAVVTKDVPAGKLAVGVPARIREPRVKPAAEPDPAGRRLGRGRPVGTRSG